MRLSVIGAEAGKSASQQAVAVSLSKASEALPAQSALSLPAAVPAGKKVKTKVRLYYSAL